MSESKSDALPLGYTPIVVEEDRFELPNPEGIDLQSTAFGHFATPPLYLPVKDLHLRILF